MDGILGFHGWQWLFVIEGMLTVLMGIYLAGSLADNPKSVSLFIYFAPFAGSSCLGCNQACYYLSRSARAKVGMNNAVYGDVMSISCPADIVAGKLLGARGEGVAA